MSRKSKEIEIKDGDYVIVNPNTGEFIDTYGEGDKIVHKEQSEHLQKYITNFNKGESFVKVFDKYIPVLGKKLTNPEFGIVMRLIPYVSYQDNVLRNNKKVLTIQEISELMDMKYDYGRKIIASLIKKGVLGIHKTGCIDKPKVMIKTIVANPYIFVRGIEINRVVAGLFEKTGWDKIL